jgi:hypothetical protein
MELLLRLRQSLARLSPPFNFASVFQSSHGGAHEFQELIQEQFPLGQSKNLLQSRLANAFPRVSKSERQPVVWVKIFLTGASPSLPDYGVPRLYPRILRAGEHRLVDELKLDAAST